MPVFPKCIFIRSHMSLSNMFNTSETFEIGRKLHKSSASSTSFLIRGVTNFLKQHETYPSSNARLNNATRNGATSTPICLKSRLENDLVMAVCSVMTLEALVLPPR